MELFKILNIPQSGMQVQKLKMEIISNNIANIDTVSTTDGSFYKRQTPVFETLLDEEKNPIGVKVKEIIKEQSAGIFKYEPDNPYANEKGYVQYPNISISREMTDLLTAQRIYEANLVVFNSFKHIINKTLEI